MSADDSTLKGDEKIVAQAKARFKRCDDWEGTARDRFIEDQKFCEGDPRNNYQWDTVIYKTRTNAVGRAKPCLTLNKTRQHCLQIVNDARQNKAQIEVRPIGDGATYEAAKIYEGMVRHIEYISQATAAYDTATWHQVTGGIGYWRVRTDYESDDSFDQEIYICRIHDPMSVYLDPDIEKYDGSDARFGFIFQDMPRDEFDNEYPEWKDKLPPDPLGGVADSGRSYDEWHTEDHVRVAEYYRKTDKADRLVLFKSGGSALKSHMSPEFYKDLQNEGEIVKERETRKSRVEWFKIAGSEIIDRGTVPGTYIPIVRVVGEETIINGELDRKGHTRAMIDAQRMYNFWASSAAEHVALQSKAPFILPLAAVEGLESYWNNANTDDFAYLPYNMVDENGQRIDKPERQQPPVMPQAYIQGMQQAQMEMMMTTGQYQAQFGENENAKSGIAIQTRQRQGDNATYHYIDHLAQAIRFTGRILIEWIPAVYDTPRVIKIMAEDGDQSEVHVQPDAQQPQAMVGPDGQSISAEQAKMLQANADHADKVKTIFNPNVGKYDVEADIGPAYATRRQETFNALSELMKQNQHLVQIAGDLLFRAADFPMADELAERFKRSIPKNILGEGPPPEFVQLQEQNKALHDIIGVLSAKLGVAETKVKQGTDKSEIDVYDAETRRMSAVGSIDPEAFKPVIRELISQALQTPIHPVMDAHAEADQARMPQPEAETV
jgi:hypothetical protein